MLRLFGRVAKWRLRVCSGIKGFRRQDPVIGASGFLRDYPRCATASSAIETSLGVVQPFKGFPSGGSIFFVGVHALVTGNCQQRLIGKETKWEDYLGFLTRRFAAAAVVFCFSLSTEILVIFLELLAGLVIFLGEACARIKPLCFSSSSPIFAFRSGTGIRFTRLSIRARRSCVWSAY